MSDAQKSEDLKDKIFSAKGIFPFLFSKILQSRAWYIT